MSDSELLRQFRRDAQMMRQRIEQLESDVRRLREVASRDPLTGLLNRARLVPAVERALAEGSRQGASTSLLLVDLDDFKGLNDRFGHRFGDEVLRRVGSVLQETARAGDQAFRYGGDEFVVLLPQTVEAVAQARAQRLQGAVTCLGSVQRPVSCSVGNATLRGRTGAPAAARLIELADRRLLASKRGRELPARSGR